MIWSNDADRLDPFGFGESSLGLNHFFPGGVTSGRLKPQFLAGKASVFRISAKATCNQLKLVIHTQSDAMNRTYEGTLTSADHSNTDSLGHAAS